MFNLCFPARELLYRRIVQRGSHLYVTIFRHLVREDLGVSHVMNHWYSLVCGGQLVTPG